jgi:dUTP pyrophosphatase
VTLRVRRLDPAAKIPRRAHTGDAGLDLHTLVPVTLGPGERSAVRTGIAIALPPGHAGLVLPRSGLARRHGVALVNAPGLIDEGYRGELEVLLLNTDADTPVHLEAGDRIAQLVVVPIPAVPVEETDELETSDRGEGGFGSSGR